MRNQSRMVVSSNNGKEAMKEIMFDDAMKEAVE